MKSLAQKNERVNIIMDEFIDACDEYLFCLTFSKEGIEDHGKKFKKIRYTQGKRLWLASDVETDQKMHARMDIKELVNRCAKNGFFTTELTKALLCMIYSLWDEIYRHKIAEASSCEPSEIFCPLMGDLRKIRHCIMHHKSIVNDNSIEFEFLNWTLPSGPLIITYEMFREFNDAIRGGGMQIKALYLAPEIKKVLPLMSKKEKLSFNEYYKDFNNKINDNEWPGMTNFLEKHKEKPEVKELTDRYAAKHLQKKDRQ